MAAVGDRRDNRTDLRGRAMARWAVVSLVVALSITSAAPVQAAAKKKVYARYVTDSSPFGQHPDEPLQGPWRLGLQDGRLIRLDDAVFASYRSEPALTPHGSQVAYYRRVRRRRRPRASPPTGRSRPWPPWRTRRASDPGPAPASARFWPQHGSGLSTVPASVWFRLQRGGSGTSAVPASSGLSSVRGEAVQQRLDQFAGGGERLVQQSAVDDEPDEHVTEQPQVRVRAHLAAGECPVVDAPGAFHA